tara:strand:+ start:28840 stop:29133 length:294 start_codon:yes stop_codon:yes gene_type:complete
MSKLISFDVAGQIEVDNHIVPNTGDYFTVKIRGKMFTTVEQDAIFVEKLGEAAVLARIDGAALLKGMDESDVAEIIAARFHTEEMMESLIETLRGLV